MEVYNSAEARALFLSIIEEKILHLSEEQLIRVLEKINVEELGALLPKVREEVRTLLFRYLSKEQIQDMLVDTFEWHRMSLAEVLAGITELFQQMEKDGEI
jgi:Mg/Co/Ni transporter MgtE